MFRTEINHFETKFSINLHDPIHSMGSCFANDIGHYLKAHKFQTRINPAGILFNPLSLFEVLDLAVEMKEYPEGSFLKSQSRHLNYKLHSEINAGSETEMKAKTEATSQIAREALKQSKLIIFTFGTAWVYRLKADGLLVANCHKVPQKEFTKSMLRVDEITNAFAALKAKIEAIQPDIKFLLTVSPVRHIKDSIPLNSVSKSVLRLACHELTQQYDTVSYFPSYEIMQDDLRDYRFYKRDLLHPNDLAIEYIWARFSELFFDDTTLAHNKLVEKINQSLSHKPFHENSPQHHKFLHTLLDQIASLESLIPINYETEKKRIRAILNE